MIRKVLAWAQRNERHLGAAVFFGGFITDLITFAVLDLSLVTAVFSVYLVLAAVFVFLGHICAPWHEAKPVWKRTSSIVFPLIAQYLIGNLLSGFLIFYTKSSVLGVSWPFLVLLLLVFAGNEWFRKYKDRITFMATLLFFTIYAYTLFALPLFIGKLGPWVFVGSTVIAVGLFSVFFFLLRKFGRERLAQSVLPITGSAIALVIVMSVSYFSGLIPPIPLTLKEAGIYHALTPQTGSYTVLREPPRAWYDLGPETLHTTPGKPLYAFTSVFAPIRFGAVVVHRWQRYDEAKKSWLTESRVAFSMSGGRADGYRGYSEIANPLPGSWRLRVETENGQVIGQKTFEVERATVPPVLQQEVK